MELKLHMVIDNTENLEYFTIVSYFFLETDPLR